MAKGGKISLGRAIKKLRALQRRPHCHDEKRKVENQIKLLVQKIIERGQNAVSIYLNYILHSLETYCTSYF